MTDAATNNNAHTGRVETAARATIASGERTRTRISALSPRAVGVPSTLTAGHPDLAIPPRFPDGRAGKASCHVRRYIITLDRAPPRRRFLGWRAALSVEDFSSRSPSRFMKQSYRASILAPPPPPPGRGRATRRGAFGNFPVPRSLAANDPFIIHIRVRRGCQRRGDERFSRGRE